MTNTALILIDVQNDYFSRGAMELEGADTAAKNARKILDDFRSKGLPIVHIEHEAADASLGFMIKGTKGQEIHPEVAPLDDEVVIVKHFPNSFWKTNLEQHLRELNVENLMIVGMMTHMCVSTTTRAAMERGFNVNVIANACATRALQLGEETIPAETVHKTALAELTFLAEVAY